MSSELFSVFACNTSGATGFTVSDNALGSGAMYLTSALFGETVSGDGANYSSLRIPKGCAFKVWESKLYSDTAAVTVHIQAMTAIGTTSGVYQTLATDTVGTSGAEVRTSRSGRPLVVESHDGTKNVRFYFCSPDHEAIIAGTYNVEVVELNAE